MFVIARLFDTADQARAAVESLKEEGFRPSSYALVTPATAAPPAAEGEAPRVETVGLTAAAMRAGQLLGEHADFYVKNLQEGQSLVVVQPPFGAQRQANEALAKHGPLDVTHDPLIEESKFVPISRQPAPLSSWLGWETLSDKAAPFSEFWGFTLLSDRLSFLTRWFSVLTKPDYALFGSNNLIASPAPLSRMFGMPTLSGRSGDGWNSSLGFPMLTDNAAPLSDSVGMPLLSRKRWTY